MAQPVWNTTSGSLGSFPVDILLNVQLSATAQSPATSLTYILLSGTLPLGLTITPAGLIFGTPILVTSDTTSTFTIRVTDNLLSIRDRTFSMGISATAIPQFTTPDGSLLSIQDSLWTRIQLEYSNPDPNNIVILQLKEGILPPGLQLDYTGLIQGYPNPPIENTSVTEIQTSATMTSSTNNLITCLTTYGFIVGRPVVFSETVFGNIENNVTYYINSVDSTTTFTISATQFGPVYPVITDTGTTSVTLPATSIGSPTIRTYSFTLKLESILGNDTAAYSITVINQNTPVSQGGPGNTPNSRIPTLLNTRPLTINVTDSDPYYGYYILPSVLPNQAALIGTIQSDNYFAFKMIGYDFDQNNILYSYSGLPLGLVGDPNSGWITGTPIVSGISNYNFSVSIYKKANPTISSVYFNFGLTVSNDISSVITWVTPANLGTIYNGTISTLSVAAISDVELTYRIVSGVLPPNLQLLSNGQITGSVADQPSTEFLELNATTDFTFAIQAYSANYTIISSTKTFTITVLQEFDQPTDILYIKATPSVQDRTIINSLLTSDTLIPTNELYRPEDQYFGKATSIIYEHAYGIYASNISEYIAAVTQNHYWRNITLGELKTAIAKNDAGEIIYEVVYSEIIDNLINPYGVSISSSIYWPRPIDLSLGPWYTSITDIYTSYADILGQEYYTSLTPGYARTLYPNSLFNMRNRVADVVGQEYNSKLLPLWMTSQQANGSTLGYTQSWVICYAKLGYADIIKTRIETEWKDAPGNVYTLNQINFQIDRFIVNKSATYNYDKQLTPPAWTGLPSATPVPDPIDSKDFYVLFPHTTILPNETQY